MIFYNSREGCDGKERREGRGKARRRDGTDGEGIKGGQNLSRSSAESQVNLRWGAGQGERKGAAHVGPPPADWKPLVDPNTICMLSGVNLH